MVVELTGKKKRKGNRRRAAPRQPILMVKTRLSEQRKRRNQRVAATALFITALVGLSWATALGVQYLGERMFTQNDRFRIRHLRCTSDRGRLKPSQIAYYAKVEEGMNLFAVDFDAIREELEGLPIVSAVSIKRDLPDTLEIRVEERVAVARIGEDGPQSLLAIDREGYLLGPGSRSPQLPAITGIRASGLSPRSLLRNPALEDALEVIDAANTAPLSGLIRLRTIDVRDPELLDVSLEDGARVLLLREALRWRLNKLYVILQTAHESGRHVASVNLSVNENFPVAYR